MQCAIKKSLLHLINHFHFPKDALEPASTKWVCYAIYSRAKTTAAVYLPLSNHLTMRSIPCTSEQN